MGKHLFAPLYIACPYTEIGGVDGEEQFFTALYIAGYNDLRITDFKLGELDLATNKNHIMNGFVQCDGIFGKNMPQIEIQQGATEVSLYPQKVNEEQLSIELLHPDGTNPLEVVRFTAKNPQRVQVEFTISGLISYNDRGEKNNATVKISIEWRGSGEQTWKPFAGITGANSYENGVSTITRSKSKVMRFVAEKVFTYDEIISVRDRIAEIRVVRVNPEATSTRTTDKIYLSAIRTWSFNFEESKKKNKLVPQVPIVEKDRDRLARIGFRIKAGNEISGTMNSLNCVLESCCRVWSKDTKQWSNDEKPTQNPASIALKTMQSKMLASNAYSDEKIDLQSFGEFYEWCEDKHFTCNGVLTSEKKLNDLLEAIFSTSRAFRVLNGKKYGVLIDKPRTIPVTIINNQNVLSANNTKSFDALPDGYKIGFIDEYDGYQKNEIIVMFEGKDKNSPDVILENIEMPFVTNRVQVYKNAMYQYACRKLRPEIWNRKLAADGRLLSIRCLVEMQDDTILVGIGDGGEITELIGAGNYVKGIVTDCNFTVTNISKRYGVKIVHADGINEPVVKTYEAKFSSTGQTNVIEFKSPVLQTEIYKPNVGDIVSFGLFDRITTDAICFGVKDNGDGTFDCTFIPYQDGVYTADKGSVPEFDSKVTAPSFGAATIPDNYATQDDIASAINDISKGSNIKPDDITGLSATALKDGIRISYTFTGTGVGNNVKDVIVQYRKGVGDFEQIPLTDGLFLFDRAIIGYPESDELLSWTFRAKIKNIYGNESENWKECTVDVSQYGAWQPSLPKIASRVSGRNTTLFLSQLPRADGREVYGKIRYQVQIKREALTDPITNATVTGDTQFYKPATDKPYLVSEDNYKDGKGFVLSDDVYMQILPLYGQNKVGTDNKPLPSPIDTPYAFSVKAINESGKTSAESIVYIIALATAARDLVNNAITNNKLAPGCVTKEKIHAHTITANELYAGNLAAGGASFGKISAGGTGLQADNNNFWDLENQEFRIGNDIKLENSGSDDAEYLHYKKDKGIFFKLKNFILSSLSSTILGVFRVKSKGSDDASGFFVVNPTDQTDDVTGTDKKTVKIKGGISADEITGTQFKGATLQLTDALASPFATISEKTKTKDLEVTKKAKIVEFEAVEATTGYLLVNTKATAGAVETFDLKVSKSTIVNDIVANGDAKVKSIAVEHGGWRATVSPCDNGVELLVCGGDNGAMQRKQLQTIISGDSMDLRISGNVYCNNIYRPNMFEAYQRIPDINNIRFVYYANNTYVACGAGIHISNNLVEWKRAGDIYSTITGVAYVRGTWFAIESGYSIYYSYDLARWNKINYSTIHFLQHISSNENVCCVTNGTGKILLIGSNAMWTEYDIGNYALHYSLCDGGKIVVFGADVVVIGKGLLGWDIKPGRTFLSAAYGREKWVAVEQGGKIFYTQNPETGVWTECYDGYKDGVKSIVYNNDMFVAFGSKTVLVSTDAISWEKHKLGEDFNYVSSITGGNFAWLVAANSNLFKFGSFAPDWKVG